LTTLGSTDADCDEDFKVRIGTWVEDGKYHMAHNDARQKLLVGISRPHFFYHEACLLGKRNVCVIVQQRLRV